MHKDNEMRKIILVLIAIATILPNIFIATSVQADNPLRDTNGKLVNVGDKVIVGTGKNAIKAEYLGTTIDNRTKKTAYKFKATIAAPIMTDSGKSINNSWSYDSKADKYILSDNLFTATVNAFNGIVIVTYNNSTSSWNPVLNIGEDKPEMGKATLLSVDPINANYRNNTIQWEYKSGKNIVALRRLRVIEGVISEYWVFDKAPNGDIKIVENFGGDSKYKRPAYALDADYNPINLASDSQSKTVKLSDLSKAVYPITIDPTSTYVTASDDGYMDSGVAIGSWANARTYDTGIGGGIYSASSVLNLGSFDYSDGDYVTTKSFVFFDTSALPDATTVTSATLYLKSLDHSSFLYTGLGAWTVYLQGGVSSTYPHLPLVDADFSYANYTGNYGSIASSSLTQNTYSAITLTASGKSAISTTGVTKFVLREKEHDVDNVTPSGDYYNWRNLWQPYAYEMGSGYWPYLEVTYTASAPDISSVDASNILDTQAQLNGSVLDDGGDSVQITFGWDTSSHAADFSAYSNNYTITSGNYTSGQTPYYVKNGLTAGTLYYFNVKGVNSGGTDYGTEKSFTTTDSGGVGAPTYFRGISANNTISLSWVTGTSANTTMVRYQQGSIPSSNTTGTLLYRGGLTYTSISGLTAGRTYGFVAYAISPTGAWSTSNATLLLTVAYDAAASEDIASKGAPTNYWMESDHTRLSNMLFYNEMNRLFDVWDLDLDIAWLIFFVLIAITIGVWIAMSTGHALFGGVVAVILMVLFGLMGQVPYILPTLTTLAMVSINYLVNQNRGM